MSEREGDSLTLRDFEAFVRESRDALLPGLQRLQEKLMETTLGKQRWREIARYRVEHSPGAVQLSYGEFIAHQVSLHSYRCHCFVSFLRNSVLRVRRSRRNINIAADTMSFVSINDGEVAKWRICWRHHQNCNPAFFWLLIG